MAPTDQITVELTTTATAVGGEAIARDGGGRVVFVDGALAGETVAVELTEERRTFARARVIEVIEASPGRIAPVCPEVAAGCGGCDWAHVDASHQFEAKAEMVDDALRRLGRIAEPPAATPGPALPSAGFRTTIRAGVVDGRAGLRRAKSHELVAVRTCRVAHPLADELLTEGRYGSADEVTIRVGARTGERMVIAHPDASEVSVPAGVTVVGARGIRGTRQPVMHEEIAGHRFRISASSFFQTRADGADALVEVVRAALNDRGGPPDRLVDLCCGVGLFAATLDAGRVVGVESHAAAAADARANLAHRGDHAAVATTPFEKWSPVAADAVVADPSRRGLGKCGTELIAATGAAVVVLVSCDAASLGRDAGLLIAAGYALDEVTLIDLFPDTSHVEAVSVFTR